MRKIFQRAKELVTGNPVRGKMRPTLNQTAALPQAPEYLRNLVKNGLPPEYPTPTELLTPSCAICSHRNACRSSPTN